MQCRKSGSFPLFSQAMSLMSPQNIQHIFITDPSSSLYTRFSACQEKANENADFLEQKKQNG